MSNRNNDGATCHGAIPITPFDCNRTTRGPAASSAAPTPAGDDGGRQLCFLLKTPDDEIAGGFIGATPDFYRRLGYEVFGERADFPAGQQRYVMVKQL